MNRLAAPGRREYRQVARIEATQALSNRVLEAFYKLLLAHWLDEITLDRVAASATTTRQTVIRMFGGKDGLIKGVVEKYGSEIGKRRKQPRGTSVEDVAIGTVGDLEIVGDMILRILCLAPRHPEVLPIIETGRRHHREWLSDTLEPQLARFSADERERVLCECLIATDTYTWSLLRHSLGKTIFETEATIADMLHKALEHHKSLQAQDRQEGGPLQ